MQKLNIFYDDRALSVWESALAPQPQHVLTLRKKHTLYSGWEQLNISLAQSLAAEHAAW